jgi:hypothetical protein
MFKYIIGIYINLFFLAALYSQPFNDRLDLMIEKYKSFDYHSVIEQAEHLLGDSIGFSTRDICEIYRLKAISYYSLLDMEGAFNSFVALLKRDPEYTLNPVHNAPKIVAYFEAIRRTFGEERNQLKGETQVGTEKEDQRPDTLIIEKDIINKSFIYSLLVPGLGHVTTKPATKSWLLFGAGIASLGLSTYYIIDTQRKEEDYLHATHKYEIERKYNTYNTVYKRRNLAIFAFATIWLYSQIDYIFISRHERKSHPPISIHLNANTVDQAMLTMQILF